jgi:hypothetical protein
MSTNEEKVYQTQINNIDEYYAEKTVCRNGHLHAVLLANNGDDTNYWGQQDCPICLSNEYEEEIAMEAAGEDW